MKLVSLNTWAGKAFEPFKKFIHEQTPTTDIFCFQEIASAPHLASGTLLDGVPEDFLGFVTQTLSDFEVYFAVTQEGYHWRPTDSQTKLGNAIIVRKNMRVIETGEVFIHLQKNALDLTRAAQDDWFTMPRLLHFVQIEHMSGLLTVFNYHGLWHVSGKGDMPERVEQSKKIQEFVKKFDGQKVLCGDFNLDLKTASVNILEQDMRNLIKEFNIPFTRSARHYDKITHMPHADYTFVSPNITVQNFAVPDIDASDHLPMILEFN
jgi:endonuclease/exonuclease/phosphatase family metal-dependent hydrolase